MKKMVYGTYVCEINVANKFTFRSEVDCEYEGETIKYAVTRFFIHSSKVCKECTVESWQLRVAKGKKKRNYFEYAIPAVLMELPGNWVFIRGIIDDIGVCITEVRLLKEHPCFRKKDN